ncbi:MAG: helix-turn-helix domain-containing protein [Proteobacteria bacterium]|nr:helix-turn-helix domain-containing protein [Pseudomonadota bacterium]
MRIELEQEDIQAIAERVVELVRPVLSKYRDTCRDDAILDVKGLCEYLKVTPKWIHERTHLKEIPYYKASNKVLRFKKREIDKWFESLKTPAINDFTGRLKAI